MAASEAFFRVEHAQDACQLPEPQLPRSRLRDGVAAHWCPDRGQREIFHQSQGIPHTAGQERQAGFLIQQNLRSCHGCEEATGAKAIDLNGEECAGQWNNVAKDTPHLAIYPRSCSEPCWSQWAQTVRPGISFIATDSDSEKPVMVNDARPDLKSKAPPLRIASSRSSSSCEE
jgi:hypothetical protein